MSRKADRAVVFVFSAFLAVTLALNLLWPKREFSEKENRYLKPFPSFSLTSLLSGDFAAGVEEYCSDHFAGRDLWISVKARLELAQGKRENNGVFLCAGERLIEPFTAFDPAEAERKTQHINSFAGKAGVPVALGLIPTSAELYSDLLPEGAENHSQRELIDFVYSLSETDDADILAALEPFKDEYIFYRTDHHWTSLGACYASDRILSAITGGGGKAPQSFAPKTVTTEFYGTAWSSSGATWIPPDSIDIFVPQGDAVVKNYPHGTEEDGTLYDISRLETKDKYSMFCGGNTPRLHVDTGSEGPHLLVLRDSYFDSELPFLLGSFSEIDVLDLRYFRTSVADFIRENGVDAVLVIYSVSNFSTDTSVFLAGR
jgi:hypothetical protein